MRKRLALLCVAGLVLSCWGLCPASPADPSLVGWWRLDDGSGTVAADASGKCVDGELFGDPVWSKDGVDGGCLLFDGVNDYVFLDGGFELANYTMAVWFRDDVAGQRDIISAYVRGVQHGILLEVGADGRLCFLHRFPLGTSGGQSICSNATVNDGRWHHAAISKSQTDIAVYIDGQSAGTMADTRVFHPTDSFGVALGTLDDERLTSSDRRYWLGAIDDVRIYNRALSADEIKALVPRKLTAYKPTPADGTIGVSVPLFQWTKSETAMFHNVYIGTSPDLPAADLKGNRLPVAVYYHAQGLQPDTMYYWRVDEIEKDGATIHTGKVWSFVTAALTAYYPTPADKAGDIPPAVKLTWKAPVGTLEHHLYLSDSLEAVTQAAAGADQGLLPGTTFSPAALESLKTYYWRVDEVLTGGGVQTGPVWSFTTTVSVDDFESYTDEEGHRIYETWIDGWMNMTGSIVGYLEAPFAEHKTVHGGKQSMPLDFDNVNAPFYSEAEREFAPTQDWTTDGAGALLLYVRGRSANGSVPVYVRLEDAAKKTATAIHPDPAFAATTKWLQWRIPLTAFAGVNLAKVKKLCIGVGDTAATKTGGKGILYLDDIELAR